MTLLLMAAIHDACAPRAPSAAPPSSAAATCRRSISAIVRSAMRSASALIAAGVRFGACGMAVWNQNGVDDADM